MQINIKPILLSANRLVKYLNSSRDNRPLKYNKQSTTQDKAIPFSLLDND